MNTESLIKRAQKLLWYFDEDIAIEKIADDVGHNIAFLIVKAAKILQS